MTTTTTTTTTNGTYAFCDADLSFSMILTCTGPSCTSLLSHNSLTCTQTASQSWDCTNGIQCGSAVGFTSKFTISDNNNKTVSQTQNVALNATSFLFQQDGAGDATVSNGTATISSGPTGSAAVSTSPPSATTDSSAASPSTSSKSGSNSSRPSYPAMLLFAMLFLGLFATQASATVTASSIGTSVNSIFQLLDKTGDGKSLFDIGAVAMAGQFNSIASKTCAALVAQGSGGLSALPLAYGQCEEAMVGAEMAPIGSSLKINLSSYAGLGGVKTTALTAAEEAIVLAADAGAIPDFFLANSALCGLLIATVQTSIQAPSSENLCAALESAVASHEPSSTAPASIASTTTTSVSKAASTTSSPPAPSSTSGGGGGSGTLPAGFASNKCLDCFLNTYLDSLQVLSVETCNHAPAAAASAYDLSAIFCDPGVVALASDPAAAAFCHSLCATPCASFDVAAVVKGLGSDYIADPAGNADQLGKLCDACATPGQVPGKYQCTAVPDCLCGLGTKLCATGCPGGA